MSSDPRDNTAHGIERFPHIVLVVVPANATDEDGEEGLFVGFVEIKKNLRIPALSF